MNIVVDQFGFTITGVPTNQVGTPEFVIAMDQNYRSTKFGGSMKSKSCLACSSGSGKVHGIPYRQVGHRTFGQFFHMRRADKLVARLGQDIFPICRNQLCCHLYNCHI